MADLKDIEHIVVLMLENRSFDNVFGFLYPAGDNFDGLDGNHAAQNLGPDGSVIQPWTTAGDTADKTMPTPDPGELFVDITRQIYNGSTGAPVAPMSGFAQDYASKGGRAADIMHCFTPADLPVLSELARSFAVSDRWFASAPCQTWPNRFFVHAGTANGYENNTMEGFPFQMQTIFNELEGIAPTKWTSSGAPWKIYFHDFPQAALLSRLWPHFGNFHGFDEFVEDAAAGQLPGYSFIEPMYYPGQTMPNDMHPPHDVRFADALVARVYNAVRSSPNWASTMMIVLFDEHGGCYDHVPPPAAIPPETPRAGQTFAFDRFGVRVPVVVISPYTQANTVLRSNEQQPFDHTSVIRTVRNCFGIAGSLSAREAAAPDLTSAINAPLDVDRGPPSVAVPPFGQDGDKLQAALARPVNGLQDVLRLVAANLAPMANGSSVDQHLQDAVSAGAASAPVAGNAGDAGAYVRGVMQGILSKFANAAPPAGAPGAGAQPGADSVYRGQ